MKKYTLMYILNVFYFIIINLFISFEGFYSLPNISLEFIKNYSFLLIIYFFIKKEVIFLLGFIFFVYINSYVIYINIFSGDLHISIKLLSVIIYVSLLIMGYIYLKKEEDREEEKFKKTLKVLHE